MISADRKLSQRDLGHWPRGLARPVAVVGLEPRDLEERCGLRFSESSDDLDRLLGAVVETEDGRTFALVRHLGAPSSGTEIWIGEKSDDPARDLTEVLKMLGLEEAVLTWIAPVGFHEYGTPVFHEHAPPHLTRAIVRVSVFLAFLPFLLF